MSNGAKVILGILTFLPFVFGACFLVYYLSFVKGLILSLPNSDNQQIFVQDNLLHFFSGPVILLAVLSFLSHIGLMIYYIVHVVTYKVKSEGEKIMWILLFIFIGTIAFILYFFIRVVPMPSGNAENNIQTF